MIYHSPALCRLLVSLLDDPRFPGWLRPMVAAAIAYFVLPADVLPEDIHGPYGYVNDIFLSVLVAARVRRVLGDRVLQENWDGKTPIIPLIDEILGQEKSLIGAQRERILAYIGWGYLEKGS